MFTLQDAIQALIDLGVFPVIAVIGTSFIAYKLFSLFARGDNGGDSWGNDSVGGIWDANAKKYYYGEREDLDSMYGNDSWNR